MPAESPRLPPHRHRALRAVGRPPRGFSLIELIVTIVVTAIALTALGVGLLAANQASVDPVVSMRAAALGQAYLEEILSKRFDENNGLGGVTRCGETGQPACASSLGPDSGESRQTFDDVDDYHGLDETPPQNALGETESRYDGFRVQVAVVYGGSDFSAWGLTAADSKRITVTVTAPIGGQFVFSAHRGNF
ncbi:MAG TPA: prepilin-type N-terminal cleavage/methylation domain-containing protein [Permianibacter sp.]|nr:prepilin-type N-terminal cleavage/methylation domain-containing protein [Permianibacter sp.]